MRDLVAETAGACYLRGRAAELSAPGSDRWGVSPPPSDRLKAAQARIRFAGTG